MAQHRQSMMRTSHIVLFTLALGPLAAVSQVVELGPEITPFQRFQLHPHLDKAFEAMSRGDGRRAISELEQAHRLAPQNAVIALHLATAYSRYGEAQKAEALLKSQVKRNPGDRRLIEALRGLERAVPPVPALAPASEPTAAAPVTETAPAAAPKSAAPTKSVDVTSSPVPSRTTPRRPAQRPASTPRQRHGTGLVQKTAPAVPGYAAAAAAYAAVDRGETGVALQHARTAAQQAPDNVEYQRLLVYLLLENGHDVEAAATMAQVEQQANLQADPAWRTLHESLQQRRAWGYFDQARQARSRGDLVEAVQRAQQGLEQMPNVLAHRLQLLGLLLEGQQYARAEQVANDGLAVADHASLRVLRAAALQAQGRTGEAAQAFDAALTMPHLTQHEQQSYRIIAADAALAAGQPERAQVLIAPLGAGTDPGVLARQAEVDTALRRVISPASLYTAALRLPMVNCFGSAYTPGCEIWPGPNPADPASEIAQAAYRAYASRDYAEAAEKAGQAMQLNPAHQPYLLLRLQALISGGNTTQAITEADRYLESRPSAPEVLALRSRLRQQLGQTEAASSDARAALQAGRLSLSSEVDLLLQEGRRDEAAALFAEAVSTPTLRQSTDPDLAYLATRVGDDRTGLDVFNRAHAAGKLPSTSLQDAAYTATRMVDNEQSMLYFREAIDAAEAGRLQLSSRQKFATRRELADRERTWGVNALLGYRGMSPGSVAAQPGAYSDIAQLVGEAYWRPQGYRDGSFWEVYGGLAQTIYSKDGGPRGAETMQGALGLRVKPLRDHNLVLAIERRIKIGSLSHNDWLVRAGYSGGFGTDLRVDVPHWNTLNVYVEAGRFLRRKQDYLTFEAQAGRSFRMGDPDARWVLFPHAVLGVDYNSWRTAAGYNGAAGAGIGLGARYWFREDKYHAPRSYLDLSLQHRWRLAGDERGKGWFLRAVLVY